MQVEEIIKKADEYIKEIDNKQSKLLAEAKKQAMVKNYQGDDRVVTFQEVYDAEKAKPAVTYIKTGYPLLDEYLGGGLREGELVLVSGYTGNGKTSWCFDVTRNMKDQNVFWLPFEESAEEFARKLIIWKKDPVHFYTPNIIANESIEWIEERILEAVIKYGSKVVFIDNLHFITMSDDVQKQWGVTGMLCKRLKQVAKNMGVVVVLIAHLRKSKEGIHKIPTFEDISGSSDAVKIANKVVAIWRECVKEMDGKLTFTGNSILAVQKVREPNGKLDNVSFTFDKGRFLENSAEAFRN